MHNNDVLRSIRYILDCNDSRLVELVKLGGHEVTIDDVKAFLEREESPGYKACNDRTMAHFLDGLVLYRRGKDDKHPLPPIELPITNNLVLKKLRVAFELKDDDMLSMLNEAGFSVSKTELSAFFRKPGHKHFRPCGDQFLRHILKGLSLRFGR